MRWGEASARYRPRSSPLSWRVGKGMGMSASARQCTGLPAAPGLPAASDLYRGSPRERRPAGSFLKSGFVQAMPCELGFKCLVAGVPQAGKAEGGTWDQVSRAGGKEALCMHRPLWEMPAGTAAQVCGGPCRSPEELGSVGATGDFQGL